MLDTLPLFAARTLGYHTFRIPGLLVTARGVVLATTEARKGGGGDYDDIDLLLRRSLDGGRTWEAPTMLADHADYGPGPMNNCSIIGDARDGAVHVVNCYDYARVFYRRSDDDGATFSAPVEITKTLEAFRPEYPWQVVATGPGHGLQLRSGRLIIPLWMADGSGTEMGAGHRGHRPSCVALIFSDDHGETWERGAIVVPQAAVKNPSETVAVELADGRVLFNMRSEAPEHRRLITISPDGVGGWSAPHFHDELLEPICLGSTVRHSWPMHREPSRILFANPDVLEKTMTEWAYDRKRLTVKLSYDECATWPVSKVLEEGPSGYSDLAVLPDGTILCLYECGSVAHMCDIGTLTLARFDLAWLTDGADVGLPLGEEELDADAEHLHL